MNLGYHSNFHFLALQHLLSNPHNNQDIQQLAQLYYYSVDDIHSLDS
jgi:hypothetical protein